MHNSGGTSADNMLENAIVLAGYLVSSVQVCVQFPLPNFVFFAVVMDPVGAALGAASLAIQALDGVRKGESLVSPISSSF